MNEGKPKPADQPQDAAREVCERTGVWLNPVREAQAVWSYVDDWLSNHQLVQDYGFENRAEVARTAILLIAGDYVHPHKGSNWCGPARRLGSTERELGARRTAIRRQIGLMHDLLGEGKLPSEIAAFAATVAPHQIVFPAFTHQEVLETIKTIQSVGAGRYPWVDKLVERVGDAMMFVLEEEYSYYIGPM